MLKASLLMRHAVPSDVVAIAALHRASYEPLTSRIGIEPLPVSTNIASLFDTMEITVSGMLSDLDAVLILQPHTNHLLIWSIAVAPRLKGIGLGNGLLAFAEARAAALDLPVVTLFTNERFVENIAWYRRHGFDVQRTEDRGERRVVHMAKTITSRTE